MATTLNSDDLSAIKDLFSDDFNRVHDGIYSIQEELENLSQDTAAGFAEVHKKIAQLDAKVDSNHANLSNELRSVKQIVDRIEHVQTAEMERADKQESSLEKLRNALKSV